MTGPCLIHGRFAGLVNTPLHDVWRPVTVLYLGAAVNCSRVLQMLILTFTTASGMSKVRATQLKQVLLVDRLQVRHQTYCYPAYELALMNCALQLCHVTELLLTSNQNRSLINQNKIHNRKHPWGHGLTDVLVTS